MPAELPDVGDAPVLTVLEEQVLRLISYSNTHQDIANRLGVTTEEVMAVKSAAMRKAHLASRAQLLAYARQREWRTGMRSSS